MFMNMDLLLHVGDSSGTLTDPETGKYIMHRDQVRESKDGFHICCSERYMANLSWSDIFSRSISGTSAI